MESAGTCSEQRLLWYPEEPPLHQEEALGGDDAREPERRQRSSTAKVVSFCDMPEVENYADSIHGNTECDTLSLTLPEPEAAAGASVAKPEVEAEEMQGRADAKRVAAAFERMAGEGILRRDCLLWAMQLAGCINPNMKWVDELLVQGRYDLAGLSHEEFGELVQQYDTCLRRSLLEKFQQTGSSNLSSESGLSSLLREVGLMPFPWVVKEIHQEVFGHGRGRFGRSAAEDLACISALLRDCAGFARSEATALRAVFARCDRDRDGRLDAAGVRAALRWLGAEEDVPKALEPLTSDAKTEGAVAKDASQLPVSEPEFLTLIRACRASEQRRMHVEFNAGNWNWLGTVDVGELPRIFEEVGVVQASPDLLKECLHACGFGHREELLFDDVCALRERFRMAHCLVNADVGEIAAAFEEFDHDSLGSIDHAQLLGALRWLGYPTSIEDIFHILEDLWLEHCRHIYSEDFQRLVAEYRDREVRHLRKELERYCGRVPPQKLSSLFAGIGYSLSSEQVVQLSAQLLGGGKRSSERASVAASGADGPLGLWDLMRVAAQCRAEAGFKVQQACGLSNGEVAELRRAFLRHDLHSTGVITGEELEDIVKEFESRRSCTALERFEAAVGGVSRGIWGRAAFKDLLRAVRRLRDYHDWDEFKKHRRVFAGLSLSHEEVDGFRDVFERFGVSRPGVITFDEIKEVLNGIVPDNVAGDDPDLARLVKQAASDGVKVFLTGLDFPDFVRVMMRLLEQDFHNINKHAGQVAKDRKSGRAR